MRWEGRWRERERERERERAIGNDTHSLASPSKYASVLSGTEIRNMMAFILFYPLNLRLVAVLIANSSTPMFSCIDVEAFDTLRDKILHVA